MSSSMPLRFRTALMASTDRLNSPHSMLKSLFQFCTGHVCCFQEQALALIEQSPMVLVVQKLIYFLFSRYLRSINIYLSYSLPKVKLIFCFQGSQTWLFDAIILKKEYSYIEKGMAFSLGYIYTLSSTTQLGQQSLFSCSRSMLIYLFTCMPACTCSLGFTTKGKGHSAGFILSISQRHSLQATRVLAIGAWYKIRMLLLLWRGQKQKEEAVDIMQFEGKLCQIPSLSSITAFLLRRVREKSTGMLIRLVILRNISHEQEPSSRHNFYATSLRSTNQISLLILIACCLSHFQSLEAIKSISIGFPLRLNREKARIQSSFLSNQKMKSFDFYSVKVSQLVTAGYSRCLELVEEAIKVKWLKYFQLVLDLTTDTINERSQTYYFLNQMKPSVLCQIFSRSFAGSTVLETQSLRAFRGETRLKVTSVFWLSLKEKSTLCQSSSMVQLKAVPSLSQTNFQSSMTVISNSVLSRPSTLINSQSSSDGQQTKG